ncbi:MAG: SOS response-associated peptidase [Candidatus Ventricola sp.]
MCGRYYIDDSLAGFEALVEELNRGKPGGAPAVSIKTGEIRPTDIAPVIANSRARRQRPFLMRWGFSAAGRDARPVINARSETAHEKPMFRASMLERRCLVPATHYFEWQAQGKSRIKHAMKPDGPLIYMAGLYRLEAGEPFASFTILTQEADERIAHIHDRMPVLLPAQWAGEWLSQTADAQQLLERARGAVGVHAFPM